MLWLIALSLVSLAVAASCYWQLRQMRRHMAATLASSDGTSLEKTLENHHRRVAEIDEGLGKLLSSHTHLAETLELASQKVSIVRFNPFGDTGGDQSFALAVLDGHDSGYILTSMHGRSGTRVYVKPVDYGSSKHQLSKEEERALKQASQRTLAKEET